MRKLYYLLITALMAMSLSGCSLLGSSEPPSGDASELVKEAFNKLYDVKTYAYEAKFGGTVDAAGETLAIDVNMSGVQDSSDQKKPKFTLAVSGSGSFGEYKDQSAKAQLKLDGENFYAILEELSDFNGQVPAELVSGFFNKWYRMPLPEGSLDQFAMVSLADDAKLTPEEKEVKALLKNTSFFKDIKFIEDKGGRHIFEGVLDKDAFIEFALKVAEIGGQPVSESEKADLTRMIENFELSGQIGIDEKTGILTMLNGSFDFNIEENGEKVVAKMTFESSMSGVDEPVEIEIPTDFTDFDL